MGQDTPLRPRHTAQGRKDDNTPTEPARPRHPHPRSRVDRHRKVLEPRKLVPRRRVFGFVPTKERATREGVGQSD